MRSAAKEALRRLQARPDLEPAYLELASRTIVARAADDMADRIHGADADGLRELMPLVCAVWSLGREVAAAEERGAGPGAVRWRLLAFQGMG
jgi:hypothetical protein